MESNLNHTFCLLDKRYEWQRGANEGELRVVKDVIGYAREKDAWIGTWDELADLKASD